MAVEVIIGSTKYVYESATSIDVKDGYLAVVKRIGPGNTEALGIFKPDEWQTAHQVGTYEKKQETAEPSVY